MWQSVQRCQNYLHRLKPIGGQPEQPQVTSWLEFATSPLKAPHRIPPLGGGNQYLEMSGNYCPQEETLAPSEGAPVSPLLPFRGRGVTDSNREEV